MCSTRGPCMKHIPLHRTPRIFDVKINFAKFHHFSIHATAHHGQIPIPRSISKSEYSAFDDNNKNKAIDNGKDFPTIQRDLSYQDNYLTSYNDILQQLAIQFPQWTQQRYWTKNIPPRSYPNPDEAVTILNAIAHANRKERLSLSPRNALLIGLVQCTNLLPMTEISNVAFSEKQSMADFPIDIRNIPMAFFSLASLGKDSYFQQEMEVLCTKGLPKLLDSTRISLKDVGFPLPFSRCSTY